jgi:hypothetical protein
MLSSKMRVFRSQKYKLHPCTIVVNKIFFVKKGMKKSVSLQA